jgi:hypothetical protein
MIIAKISVTPLAIDTGILLLKIPYRSHSKVPKVKRPYIDSEIPEVSFVLMVFTACGIKDNVVQNAAARPRMVI